MPPTTLPELLAAARDRLDRVAPGDLTAEMEAGAIIVDTREQRPYRLPNAQADSSFMNSAFTALTASLK